MGSPGHGVADLGRKWSHCFIGMANGLGLMVNGKCATERWEDFEHLMADLDFWQIGRSSGFAKNEYHSRKL
jgi:hypothetical protein